MATVSSPSTTRSRYVISGADYYPHVRVIALFPEPVTTVKVPQPPRFQPGADGRVAHPHIHCHILSAEEDQLKTS